MQRLLLLIIGLFCIGTTYSQQYWKIDEGKNSITWQIKPGEEHYDHIEMAGKRVAVVLRYGVDKKGDFHLNKSMVWPMLRTIPNNTHASLMRRFEWNPLQSVTVNGGSFKEQVKNITLNGTLEVNSEIKLGQDNTLSLKRIYFPSTEQPALCEIYKFTNTGKQNIRLELPKGSEKLSTDKNKGVDGAYQIYLSSYGNEAVTLSPGQQINFTATVSAYKSAESPTRISCLDELKKENLQLMNGWKI